MPDTQPRNRRSPRKQKKPTPQSKTTDKEESKASSSSWAVKIFNGFLIMIVLSTIYLIYKCKNSPISSVTIDDFPELHNLDWPFGPNTDLQRGRRLHEHLRAPESIAVDDKGNIYTGSVDGRIYKIKLKANGDIGEGPGMVSIVEPKVNYSPEESKSRPLGLRYHNDKLFVADSWQGIYSINLKTNHREQIVDNSDVKPPLKFTDDLVLSADGQTLYFSDASSRWDYNHVAYSVIEGDCSGRLFKVNLKTKDIQTLIEGICFANGLQLSPDEKKLLLSETGRSRVKIIDLNSHKVIKTTILPGGPDNIRSSVNGGYWVAIPNLHDFTMDLLMKYPLLRDTLASIFREDGLFAFSNLNRGVVVKLSEEGDVTRVLYDLEGKVSRSVTQVTELKTGRLLLSSFSSSGIVEIEPSK